MNDPVLVQILQATDNLHRVALHFQFVESFAALEQLVHALVLAELEQDVHVLAVFEEVLKVANVAMLDTAVNLDLAHELLLGAALCQARLLNHFRGMHKTGVGINEFVAFCKSALAKELAFDVSSDAYLAVFLEFLFNYCLSRRCLPWLMS
jgi:hypothetical protein